MSDKTANGLIDAVRRFLMVEFKFGSGKATSLSGIMEVKHSLQKSCLIFAILSLFFIGCSSTNKNDNPEVYNLIAPNFIPIGFADTVYLHLSVRDPQGLDDIDIVYFTIERPDGSLEPDTYYMYDDGLNGDLTAGDGEYSFGISGPDTSSQTGDYIYHFSAKDNGNLQANTIHKIITVDLSANPYVYDLIAPDYLQNGFPGIIVLSVSVSDPQGLDSIDKVYFRIKLPDDSFRPETLFMTDDGQGGDMVAGDGLYSCGLSGPTFSEQNGDHVFYFTAVDDDGNQANTIEKTMPIDERPNPYVYDLSAPDSLLKGSLEIYYLFLNVWDPQGLDDIDSVYFTVTRPDGTSNEVHFYMHDDGLLGDSTSGDGAFTLGIQAPSTENQSGNYTFHFTARDNDNHPANTIDKSITAYDGIAAAPASAIINNHDILTSEGRKNQSRIFGE